MTGDLQALLRQSAYHDYVYAYPHKTAYRTLQPRVNLADAWSDEDVSALHLYVHVPFCEMRCGFCNLFTLVPHSNEDRVVRYLDALAAQAEAVRDAVPGARFAQMAIGGGTPSVLSVHQLEDVLDLARDVMGADPHRVPCSVEVSPATVDEEKLALLRARGVSRISIGVQSFETSEVRAVLRPQDATTLGRTLRAIATCAFPAFNIDLMYGLPGQTVESLVRSVDAAIARGATELYLYPLYVRPQTGLGRRGDSWPDRRRELYDAGCAALAERGFAQCSMRRFRAKVAPPDPPTPYRCQADGMIGLGPGARSYTRRLHYSTRYAVDAVSVKAIVDEYSGRPDHTIVDHGFRLDADEERRRWLILSLLDGGGADSRSYHQRFGTQLADEFPELDELRALELAGDEAGTLRLTAAGVEVSDTIGHWLFSPRVRTLMAALA